MSVRVPAVSEGFELPSLRRQLVPVLAGSLAVALALGLGVVAVEKPMLALAASAALLVATTMAINPSVATYLVLAILYSNAAGIAVRLYGLPFFLGASVVLLLLAPFIYVVVVRRLPLLVTPALPYIIGFVAVLAVSAIFSDRPKLASTALIAYVLEGLALYIVLINVVRTSEMLRRVVWLLLIVGGLIGALSFFQTVTLTFDNDYFGFAQANAVLDTGTVRAGGPVGQENRFGQIMLVLVPLGLFRVLGERSPRLRVLAAVATAFIGVGVIVSFSRGAGLGLIVVLVTMVVMRYIRLRQAGALIAASVFLLFALPDAVTQAYGDRLSTLGALSGGRVDRGGENAADSSIRARATEQLTALAVFVDHPFLGVGADVFPSAYQEYAERILSDRVDVRDQNTARESHSLYLGLAAETGALGLLLFLGAIFVTLRGLVRSRRRWLGSHPDLASTATAFMLALVAYLVTGFFLHLSSAHYFWLLLALAGAAARIGPEDADRSPAPAARGALPAPRGRSG